MACQFMECEQLTAIQDSDESRIIGLLRWRDIGLQLVVSLKDLAYCNSLEICMSGTEEAYLALSESDGMATLDATARR
jgi:hypothetical protein